MCTDPRVGVQLLHVNKVDIFEFVARSDRSLHVPAPSKAKEKCIVQELYREFFLTIRVIANEP